jgi:hypothetical protein
MIGSYLADYYLFKSSVRVAGGSGRLNHAAIGANPLLTAHLTRRGGGGEGIEEREGKRGEGRIPYFDPLVLF